MGEVAVILTKQKNKKKKKGRPSLLDLQKRALKQQQLLQQNIDEPHAELISPGFKNPSSLNPALNSRGRSSHRNSSSEDDEDGRRDKKHRLLHGFNTHDRRNSSNFKFGETDLDADASIRSRKSGAIVHGSDDTGVKDSKARDILQKSLVETGLVTPLPDKKLLLFILDRLQKKDTYGVFSDPVDPEELPDYHEIIKNPMDFTTLRKKLEIRAYANLEQFERDVFLICTNAMEYNSEDTVYFRQARAMLEIAKKNFENLRQESDGEEPVALSQQPKVVKRCRPPGTGVKKHTEPSLIDRTTSEISADAAAHTPGCGDGSRFNGAYNLRTTPPYKFCQEETSVRIKHNTENQSGLLIDWEKEFPRSVVKAINKYGMKNVDENRRDTYSQISTSLQEASIFTTLEEDLKQLTPVGLKNEYCYSRSIARYAEHLGPAAWRSANRRIEKVLPTGIEFGPGWIGENPEAPPPQQESLMSRKQKCSNHLASDDHYHSSRMMSPTTSASSAIIGKIHSSHVNKETAPASRVLNQETDQLGPVINPESNGLFRGFSRFNHSPNQRTELAFSQQGFFPKRKQECDRFPPDLNAGISSPKSPGSNHRAGSSQHPDLALQL